MRVGARVVADRAAGVDAQREPEVGEQLERGVGGIVIALVGVLLEPRLVIPRSWSS